MGIMARRRQANTLKKMREASKNKAETQGAPKKEKKKLEAKNGSIIAGKS